jgi:hypothetical protein
MVRLVRRWIAIPVVLLAVCGAAQAQRRFKTIEPAKLDDKLKFDVNLVPVGPGVVESGGISRSSTSTVDLNFAPNIEFTADSSKAFVSFSGSDKVLAFNPKTGEILDLITVGKNPSQITMTPDGSAFGVVCLELLRNLPESGRNFLGEQVATIAMIDAATHAVRRLDLTEVFLSFANNILFSADGKTGFVASAATDELIRFDVDTMTEVGPRLKFTPGSRPTSMTMAPDFSFMTVVLVGSTNLNRLEHPDAVAIVDPVSFQIVRTLAPRTGPGVTEEPIIHDFTATTTVAISADGKYGMIADQTFSGAALIPELSTDRAWLIDFTKGEFKKYNVGGVATASYWAPSGRFVVMSALEFAVIEPGAAEARRLLPLRSEFRPRSRPVFSPDGRWMYVAAPLSDTLMVFNLLTDEFPRFVEIGGQVDRGGSKISSAPLQLAYTPDQSVLVVLNFNANTIDLVRRTDYWFVPRAASDSSLFTGIALTNASTEAAEVIVTGLSNTGIQFADKSDTTDVVEFVNPRIITLAPGAQLARTSEEIIVAAGGAKVEGWFDLDSDQPALKSFFLTGDHNLKRLDGTVATGVTSQKGVVPEARVTGGMVTELTVLNPNRQTANYTVNLVGQDGKVLGTFNRQVPARSLYSAPVRDPDPNDQQNIALFPESAFQNWVDGYLVVNTATGVVAYARYFDGERMSSLLGTPVSVRDPQPTRLLVPQVAVFGGADTFLKLVNSNPRKQNDQDTTVEIPIQVTLTLLDDEGAALAAPVTVELGAGVSLRRSIQEWFGLQDPGTAIGGWLVAESDKPGLVGSAEIQLFQGKAMTSLPLSWSLSEDLVFSHVAQGLGLSTGLALVNPGDEPAQLTIEVHKSDGETVRARDAFLEPGQRLTSLLIDLFPDLPAQVGGYLRVRSDQPLAGIELFFADNLQFVSAVGAQ